MIRFHHECLTCTCPDHLDTWMQASLVNTADPADLIPTSQAYQHYLAWWFAADKPAGGLSQNKLTRQLRRRGVPIIGRGGQGNQLIGYRLAS